MRGRTPVAPSGARCRRRPTLEQAVCKLPWQSPRGSHRIILAHPSSGSGKLASLRQRYGSNQRSIEVRIHRHKDRHAAHAHVSGAESRSRTICVARHTQYNIGATYALLGETRQSVSWLKKASREGLPCYPLFERDPTLDSLRPDPEFVAFMQQLNRRRSSSGRRCSLAKKGLPFVRLSRATRAIRVVRVVRGSLEKLLVRVVRVIRGSRSVLSVLSVALVARHERLEIRVAHRDSLLEGARKWRASRQSFRSATTADAPRCSIKRCTASAADAYAISASRLEKPVKL